MNCSYKSIHEVKVLNLGSTVKMHMVCLFKQVIGGDGLGYTEEDILGGGATLCFGDNGYFSQQ